jgi:hypothetical protein
MLPSEFVDIQYEKYIVVNAKNCKLFKPRNTSIYSIGDYINDGEEALLRWIYLSLGDFFYSERNIPEPGKMLITKKQLTEVIRKKPIKLKIVAHDLFDVNDSLSCGIVKGNTIRLSKSC